MVAPSDLDVILRPITAILCGGAIGLADDGDYGLADGGNRADVRARELKLAAIATGLAIVVLLLDYIGNKIWPKQPKKTPDETEDVLRTRDND